MKKSVVQRLLSLWLTFVLVFSGTPLSQIPAYAAGETAQGYDGGAANLGEIIAYEELAPDIAGQTVPLGTDEAALNLPEVLTATVRLPIEVASPVTGSADEVLSQDEEDQELNEQGQKPGEANPLQAGPNQQEDGRDQSQDEQRGSEEAAGGSQPVLIDLPVPVRWTASPAYDGNTAGKYRFTATAEGYTVSAEPPVITVTVGSMVTEGQITAFIELDEEIRWQNTGSPEFPETVEAIIEGKTVSIPVTWKGDPELEQEYDAQQRGLYVFTADIGEGYTVAEGVELPRLTVYIPQTAGLMMARMAASGATGNSLEISTASQLVEIATLVNAGKLEQFLLNNNPNAKVSLILTEDIDLSPLPAL